MKKSACLFLAWILLSMQLAGCQSKSKTPTEQSQISDTQNSETLQQETLAENFQYEENDNDGITITNYIGDEMNVTIPERIANKVVTCIGKHAFQGKDIQSVDMPDSITEIEYRGFAYNTSLKTVNLSQNLSVIGTEAFMGCSSLAIITLPNTLITIGASSFRECTQLKHVTIPSSTKIIGDQAFDSAGLETVIFEDGIEKIGGYGSFAHTKNKTTCTTVFRKRNRQLCFFCLPEP